MRFDEERVYVDEEAVEVGDKTVGGEENPGQLQANQAVAKRRRLLLPVASARSLSDVETIANEEDYGQLNPDATELFSQDFDPTPVDGNVGNPIGGAEVG
jgi:hypothetical protein